MRTSFSIALLMFLLSCGKPSESTTEIIEDTTQVGETPVEMANLSDEEKKWGQLLDRFMEDFAVAKDGYPSIGYSIVNEVVSYHVRYYFEDEYLIWAEIARSEEGGIAENFLVSRDPEGTFYLHYGTEVEGAFGYVGMEGGDWYKVKPDGNYKPRVLGVGVADKFEYEIEFEEIMKTVRGNMDKFVLKDGRYVYTLPSDVGNVESYEVPEVLYNSNLLSATSFNPDMIRGYLDTWYPLYESASGGFYRHKVCVGDEDFITLRLEAGNYRWEEQTSGQETVYAIKGFEESEGDAFYATIERNGDRLSKILIYSENDRLLMIDSKVYTAEPGKYDYITLRCD